MNAGRTDTNLDNMSNAEWHDGQIPDFVGPALDALYGSLYSSLPQLALGNLTDTSTYVARNGNQLRALFLYTLAGREARIINEGMRIVATDADHFARQLFQRFDAIDRIEFHAIACDSRPTALPSLGFTLDEDIVIALPATEAGYLNSLGKSTRKSLRQNLARAQTQGLRHEIIPGHDIDASMVETLIGFNHARLAAKQRSSALDRVAATQLLTLVRACGMAGTVTLNGRLSAGTLACRVGDDVYSLVNAHDPAFDALGMGNLSRHLMIVAAIHSGARRFHLLGGNFNSKRACGARRQALHHWVIYRDRLRMIADLPHLLSLALREQRYRLGKALDDATGDVHRQPTLHRVAILVRLIKHGLHAGKTAQ